MPAEDEKKTCTQQQEEQQISSTHLCQGEVAEGRNEIQAAPENSKTEKHWQEEPTQTKPLSEGKYVLEAVRPMHASEDCQNKAWKKEILDRRHELHRVAMVMAVVGYAEGTDVANQGVLKAE